MKDFSVHIAENDCYGNVIGKTNCIIIYDGDGEQVMYLEPSDMRRKKINTNDWQVIMYNKLFKMQRTGSMVGNCFWNEYQPFVGYLVGFIQALQESKEWDCTEAWSKIFNKWKRGELITEKDLGLPELEKASFIEWKEA
jgi:hypothetical protein